MKVIVANKEFGRCPVCDKNIRPGSKLIRRGWMSWACEACDAKREAAWQAERKKRLNQVR